MEDCSHQSGYATPVDEPSAAISTSLPNHLTQPTLLDRMHTDEVTLLGAATSIRPRSTPQSQDHRVISLPFPWRGNHERDSASDSEVPATFPVPDQSQPRHIGSSTVTAALQGLQSPPSPEASRAWRSMTWRNRVSSIASSNISRGPKILEGYGQARVGAQNGEHTRSGLQQSRYASSMAGNHVTSRTMTFKPTRILQSGVPHGLGTTASVEPITYEPKPADAMPDVAIPKPEYRTYNHIPNPGGKEYCTYYLRNGQCDYMQRTCQYKHFFPSTWNEMERIGFICLPDWLAQIKPDLYKEVSDRLGPCPWGSFSGSRASKSRADVTREHLAAYGKNNQHASEREMIRGRKPDHPQLPRQFAPDRRNRYAPARGSPGHQPHNACGPQAHFVLDADISQPASPARALPPALDRGQSSPSEADDDTDTQSIASVSDLMAFSSRHTSVSRFSPQGGKQDARHGCRGSTLRNQLFEAEPPVEHPVFFQNSCQPRDQAQVDLVEARDAEHRRSLEANAAQTDSFKQFVATKQKRPIMSDPDRIQQQVLNDNKSNSKSHPAGNMAKQAFGNTTDKTTDEATDKADKSQASSGRTSADNKKATPRKRIRVGKKHKRNKHDQDAVIDLKDARIKELESMIALEDPKDARIRQLEAQLAARSLFGSSGPSPKTSPPTTSGSATATAAPPTAAARRAKGKGKGQGRAQTVSAPDVLAQEVPSQSESSKAATVGTTSTERSGNSKKKGKGKDKAKDKAKHSGKDKAKHSGKDNNKDKGKGRAKEAAARITPAQDMPGPSAPVQPANEAVEQSSPGKEPRHGSATEAKALPSAAVPVLDQPAPWAPSKSSDKTDENSVQRMQAPSGPGTEVKADNPAAVPSVSSVSAEQAEK